MSARGQKLWSNAVRGLDIYVGSTSVSGPSGLSTEETQRPPQRASQTPDHDWYFK